MTGISAKSRAENTAQSSIGKVSNCDNSKAELTTRSSPQLRRWRSNWNNGEEMELLWQVDRFTVAVRNVLNTIGLYV